MVPGEAAAKDLLKKGKEDMDEEEKKNYLEGILDDYYNLDYEDLIGGGQIKTRFKYRKVAREDYGLTEDEILLLDDRQLNKIVNFKKYRPYMDAKLPSTTEGGEEAIDSNLGKRRKMMDNNPQVNLHRVKNMKKKL